MAAFLWHIAIEAVSKEQRRIAKNLVLGCGYGLGWKKFIEYCAREDIIIDEPMSKRAVNGYRELHTEVVAFWGDVERCAKAAVKVPGTVVRLRSLIFVMRTLLETPYLLITLPSGRHLYYPFPKLEPIERFGRPDTQLSYRTTYFSKWLRNTTYGGKLVENIVQALARDIMVEGMWKCEEHGYPVVGTVHDEVIAELPLGKGNVKEMERVVAYIPPWALGCPITAEGFEAQRYRKG